MIKKLKYVEIEMRCIPASTLNLNPRLVSSPLVWNLMYMVFPVDLTLLGTNESHFFARNVASWLSPSLISKKSKSHDQSG